MCGVQARPVTLMAVMLAEGLMATVLSGDTLTLTAPRSTAEFWFCIRFQVCLKI
jgi:hypothetical protein